MKTLKKISLKSASVLDDKQLKQIYGGSGTTDDPTIGKDCMLFCGDNRRGDGSDAVWSGKGPCPTRAEVEKLCGSPIPSGTSCNCA